MIRAAVSGFCSGVKRAIRLAEECAKSEETNAVYALGELVHNSQVMDRLEEQGVVTVDSADDIPSGTAIIRAHGATPDALASLEGRGIAVVDATCPKVKRSHEIISEHDRAGFQVVIAGERNHSEVHGLVSRASSVHVVETAAEVDKLRLHPPVMLLAQTTFSPVEFDKIRRSLTCRFQETKVFHTICPAMARRHEALVELSSQVEAIVVVGGRNSANTRRLFERAMSTGVPAWHIERADELPASIFGYERIGITAGASTPDWIVDAVESRLEKGRLDDG